MVTASLSGACCLVGRRLTRHKVVLLSPPTQGDREGPRGVCNVLSIMLCSWEIININQQFATIPTKLNGPSHLAIAPCNRSPAKESVEKTLPGTTSIQKCISWEVSDRKDVFGAMCQEPLPRSEPSPCISLYARPSSATGEGDHHLHTSGASLFSFRLIYSSLQQKPGLESHRPGGRSMLEEDPEMFTFL